MQTFARARFMLNRKAVTTFGSDTADMTHNRFNGPDIGDVFIGLSSDIVILRTAVTN